VSAVAIDLDALGDTRALWADWLEDAARRFRSIAPLDPASLSDNRGLAAEQLDRWAESGVGDWRAALVRFAEDRAPVYLRPDARVSAALRRLHAGGAQIHVFTDAPEALARVALAHLGASRRVTTLECGDSALERVQARLGGEAAVVSTARDLARLDDVSSGAEA
jgi:phosphoglycolate phosphatase-like HAD superfamily hydrolase